MLGFVLALSDHDQNVSPHMKAKFTSWGLFLTVLFNLAASGAESAKDYTNETAAQREARMAWFNDARFGMFIHWGVYSVPAGEWEGKKNYGEWFMEETKMPVSQYEKFAEQFNPVKFDARAWVKAAKNAGMKYIVITSKHHDGFGMYRSDLTDWCIKSTPFQRDPLKELADACAAEGITFCFYHSIMDWHHPDWGQRRAWNDKATGTPDMDRYTAYMKGQLKELLTRYGPIGILWFDGEWDAPWTHDRGVDLYNYVRGLQPQIIINNRVGKARSGMAGMDQGKERVGDYGTPEQNIPARGFGPGVSWESCMTMNDHWGYNRNDDHWKSTQTLVRNLIDCASKGGNYLLNVGPTSEGLIPDASVERLQQIGNWMKVNQEAIYGTTASPFARLAWGRCTTKAAGNETTLYLHVFDWPKDGKLVVPGLKCSVKSARLLASGQSLKFGKAGADVVVDVPTSAPDAISSTVALTVSGKPEVNVPVIGQAADGSVKLLASEADLQGELQYEVGGGKDNIGYWINPDDTASWSFKLERAGKFKVVAEIASQGQGRFEISVAGQKVQGTAPDTGDYAKFKTVEISGNLEIAKSGNVTLTVKPIAKEWQPLNLKSLKLQPVGP
jgi:alpha-L-fucosidase